MERLLSGDSGGAEDSMSALLGGFVPPEENAPKAPHGDFYRIFLDSLFAVAVQNIRDCKSLFGSGFAEITFRSAGCTYAAVIRIEYAPDSTAGLHTLAARALEHLGEKGCAKALLSKQKIKGVAECGMAFRGRSCAVCCRSFALRRPAPELPKIQKSPSGFIRSSPDAPSGRGDKQDLINGSLG